MEVRNKNCAVRRISPGDGFYFFGYYDLPAFDQSEKYHLTHKTSFMNRLQTKGDTADIGLIEIESGKYSRIETTRAWNFQQGAMLQWNPCAPDREIIYNDVLGKDYVGVIMDIHTGKKRFLDRPVANVSPKGDYALSINFSRLYDFRPGYGYAAFPDKFYYKNHPQEDGIFLINLSTGKSKLIISLDDIWDFSGGYFGNEDKKLVINHITFNTDASRFLFLSRNFPKAGETHKTAVITANYDGSEMYLLSDYGYQSHYNWRDKEHVIFYSDGKELSCSMGRANNYVLKDKTYDGYLIEGFDEDNHMSYSPDRRYLITDTYPDNRRMQTLKLYDINNDICTILGNFYSLPVDKVDIRCDLHPRWNRSGSAVTFDSTHEGFRGIYLVDIDI